MTKTSSSGQPLLPASIVIAAVEYTVTADQALIDAASVEAEASLRGETDHERQTIVVAPDLAPGRLAETLLHEVIHCITECAGINAELGAVEEEKIVRRVAPLLLDVIRRNPDLIAYLTGGAA